MFKFRRATSCESNNKCKHCASSARNVESDYGGWSSSNFVHQIKTQKVSWKFNHSLNEHVQKDVSVQLPYLDTVNIINYFGLTDYQH